MLMGSTSIIVGELVTPTSPVEVAPPASATRGGVSTLASTTRGEVSLLSTAPCDGVAVCASSASTSPTTFGSSDLVRDGEDGAPKSPCGATAGLHVSNTTSIREFNSKKQKLSLQDITLHRSGCEAWA
jgi:hypothetical protein